MRCRKRTLAGCRPRNAFPSICAKRAWPMCLAISRVVMLDDTLSLPSASRAASQRWTIFVASTGGALEVFDFVIYGFFAQHIGRVFFPPGIGLAPATLSFAVLAIGHLSRPLGGLFLGRLGDKYGRRIVFMSSALVAALATLAIGMLPSYAALGIAAPLALLTLRLVQGLCLG